MGTVSEFTPEAMDTEVLPGLVIKADGVTMVRNTDRLRPTSSSSPVFADGVASKDVVFDAGTGIWGRVFLPESVTEKLPLVVYFHGGGFCLGDAGGESSTYQATRLCKTSNVVVISTSYRLAPEHRLPTAFHDATTTMTWIHKQASSGDMADPWLVHNVDFARVFIMGQSAGGNIAHHVTLSSPLPIAGVIPVVPFFSKKAVSESEKEFLDDDVLPLARHHAFWRLALPEGATRDHPFCNPLAQLDALPIPRMLLIVAGKDPLYSRQMEYYQALKQAGKEVALVEVPEGSHIFRKNPALEAENVRVDKAISDFIFKC